MYCIYIFKIRYCAYARIVFGLCSHNGTGARVYTFTADNWLEPCGANGIVMTSAGTARSHAIDSSITWIGTWLLVLTCLLAYLPEEGRWPIPFPAD